jgi:hypothetical protein
MHMTKQTLRDAGNDNIPVFANAEGPDTGDSKKIIRARYSALTEQDLMEAQVNLIRYFEIAFAITVQQDRHGLNLTRSKAVSRMNERSNNQNKS